VFIDNEYRDVPVYQRDELPDAIDGPAIVEQYDTTTYVAPGWRAEIDTPALRLCSLATLTRDAQDDSAVATCDAQDDK
jgi:N-methylhydantoinase A/oxoprolinase/acetone carboxylase beta subunit